MTASELTPGSPAPDFEFVDAEGAHHTLSELWQNQTLVLLFLRHFG